MKIDQRCLPIELILADVDGVLTGGQIVFDNEGIETKQFHIRDGLGIRLWQRAGYRFGLITGAARISSRSAPPSWASSWYARRPKTSCRWPSRSCRNLQLEPQQVCYIGDDLPDLPVVRHVGLGVAVADACGELREAAHYVTQLPGGTGAVREVIEMILKAQRRWDDLIQKYTT